MKHTNFLPIPLLIFVLLSFFQTVVPAADFSSNFKTTPDRIWPGRHYWPNPMENWRVQDGRLTCTTEKTDRNVHLLTHTLGPHQEPFSLKVTLGLSDMNSEPKTHFDLSPGDSLENESEKPRIQNRGLSITAEVSRMGDTGVLIAQGGGVVGFTLYVTDGKPAFAVRNEGQVQNIVASDAPRAQQGTLSVHLQKNGRADLKFNGRTLAAGNVGTVEKLPIDGLQVGRDLGTQVGPYSGPSPFNGKLDRVTLELGERSRSRRGAAGFEIGVTNSVGDYRATAFRGNGLKAVITADNRLHVNGQSTSFSGSVNQGPIQLTLHGKPKENGQFELTFQAAQSSPNRGETSSLRTTVPANKIEGAVRLTHNPGSFVDSANTRFWFQGFQLTGENVRSHPDRSFGPILWTMYSLHNPVDERGYILKMSAQMPPLGDRDNRSVRLQVKNEDRWKTADTATIAPDARNAIFRVTDWPSDRDVHYRVVYRTERTNGETVRDSRSGVIQQSPDREETISVADLNCQVDYAFPYEPVARNARAVDPDLLLFAGDQLYEGNGGYGVVREPADQAIINYLRKFYMFGWAFGDLMRNRPTICLPDDHDVFQGNLWGEGGEKLEGGNTSTTSGYIEPVRTVNAIFRSQTGHHPGVQNLKPTKRGIRAYHGEVQYGWLSMAVIADRHFKSGPRNVDTGSGRPDIVREKDINTKKLDKPKLKLLGERQLQFLEDWVRNWEHTEMKTVFSQTTFSNVMTHTGPNFQRVYADLDSNAWPQSGRDRALRILRKGFVFHLAGDQHVPTLSHHGMKRQRDSIWTFVAPAIAVGWPRKFTPDEVDLPYSNRPDHGLPNTGEYKDGFHNKMYVYAVGNPPIQDAPEDAPSRYRKAHRKASGFGVAVFDRTERTITTNAYKFYAGRTDGDHQGNQFPGWPTTVTQMSNYGRPHHDRLPAVSMEGVDHPVVQVIDQERGELIYAIRSPRPSFRPFVFEPGAYKVRVGHPEENRWKSRVFSVEKQ